jgi:eukaryotic-like serine/threonine-protein kinase
MIYPCQKAMVSFNFINEIGQEGKNSQVYLARDANLDGEIVIKKINKSNIPEVAEYFKEARNLYKSTHPNVVQVTYACEDENYIYIAMPYYKNGSLKTLIESRFITCREVIKYSTEFLSGLHNIHSKRLVHMDIKPDNILISERNEGLISDFGLAKHLDPDGKTDVEMAYPKIMPPEIFTQEGIIDRSYDIYQAGMTLYILCIGYKNFNDQFSSFCNQNNSEKLATAIISGKFPNRLAFPEHIPKKLKNIINKCLHVNTIERPKSALDIINALADIDGDFLDWNYTINPDESRVWKKNTSSGYVEIKVNKDHSSEASKESNGRITRMREYCLDRISPKNLTDFLGID